MIKNQLIPDKYPQKDLFICDVADAVYQLAFIPFFLENIVTDLKLLQEDELHPTAEAQPLLLKSILPTVMDSIEI